MKKSHDFIKNKGERRGLRHEENWWNEMFRHQVYNSVLYSQFPSTPAKRAVWSILYNDTYKVYL